MHEFADDPPIERVVAEVPADTLGSVIELITQRRGKLVDLEQGETRARAEFLAPSRGLFGIRSTFLSLTAGDGLLSHVFDGYEPLGGPIRTRRNGSLVSMEAGEVFAYALFKLQYRCTFFVAPVTDSYPGLLIGQTNPPVDIEVNVCKNKKLTNVRASGSDDNIVLSPPRLLTLEACLEYLAQDELLEATPKHLRLRKRTLDPHQRKREAKQVATG
jgi:GTP-binding protein